MLGFVILSSFSVILNPWRQPIDIFQGQRSLGTSQSWKRVSPKAFPVGRWLCEPVKSFTSSFSQCFAEIYPSIYLCFYICQYIFLNFFSCFILLAKYIIPYFSPLANFTLTSPDRWQEIFSCGFPTFLQAWLHIHKQSCQWSHLLTDKAMCKK